MVRNGRNARQGVDTQQEREHEVKRNLSVVSKLAKLNTAGRHWHS